MVAADMTRSQDLDPVLLLAYQCAKTSRTLCQTVCVCVGEWESGIYSFMGTLSCLYSNLMRAKDIL